MKFGIVGNIIIDNETTIIYDIFKQYRSINDLENAFILYVGYYNSKANIISNFNILER